MMALPALASPSLQGANLLQNPLFEQGLEGWDSWFYENIVMEAGNKNQINTTLSFHAPDFLLSESKWDHESGGKDERRAAAAVSGLHYLKFRGGLYQVAYVAPGSRVRFSVWANGFCEDERGVRCPVRLRAGIDPTGGTDWRSGNVRWVEIESDSQQYVLLTPPDVQVPNGRVTVFTWGETRYPVIYSAAYFDEASLVVTVPPTPTGAAPTEPPPPPTETPCAQMRVVSDVTAPDNTPVAPGNRFTKTWRVQNSGTCAWSGTLAFVGSGDQMGGQSPTTLPQIEIGQVADVSINLVAPAQPGSYQGTWEARTTEGIVLGHLIVKINVISVTATPLPAFTATPQRLAASPTSVAGQICVLAFDDRNDDGQQGMDENLLAGVTFTLLDSDRPKDTYTTDGLSEPHCFAGLPQGSYQVAMELPADHRATTSKMRMIVLNSGTKTTVAFGAKHSELTPVPTKTHFVSNSAPSAQEGLGARSTALIVSAVIVLIGLGLVVGYAAASRR
jgi:hypothetical protein